MLQMQSKSSLKAAISTLSAETGKLWMRLSETSK